MERKRVLVAFGDVSGFRKWIIRAVNAPEVASELMESIYSHFENFSKRTGYYIKYLGDGLMIVKELGTGHNCVITRTFMNDSHLLAEQIRDELTKVYPRPDGFRIRDTYGHVWKRMSLQRIHGKLIHIPEYIGYPINMAQSLLYVYPEILHICHEGNVELIGTKKNGLVVELLEPPKERRNGIDPQDFLGLYSVTTNESH